VGQLGLQKGSGLEAVRNYLGFTCAHVGVLGCLVKDGEFGQPMATGSTAGRLLGAYNQEGKSKKGTEPSRGWLKPSTSVPPY
jgi:hypothetical protein